jgi:hypothetical protein
MYERRFESVFNMRGSSDSVKTRGTRLTRFTSQLSALWLDTTGVTWTARTETRLGGKIEDVIQCFLAIYMHSIYTKAGIKKIARREEKAVRNQGGDLSRFGCTGFIGCALCVRFWIRIGCPISWFRSSFEDLGERFGVFRSVRDR